MKKFDSKRKGFTLVELLIVIVVIGILSAMMMMSSTEAVTSAKASNIVSNLRNLKTAALALYTDHMDEYNKSGAEAPTMKKGTNVEQGVLDYLSNGESLPDADDYTITRGTGDANNGSWYIVCTIKGSDAEKTKIQEKLAGRTASLALLDGGSLPESEVNFNKTKTSVAIKVR